MSRLWRTNGHIYVGKWKIVQCSGRPETAISKKGGYIYEHTMWWAGPSEIRDFQYLDFGDGILHNLGSPVFSFGNPKISQDKIFENPGIGIWKNPRIPGYPRFPLMPGDETKKNDTKTCFQKPKFSISTPLRRLMLNYLTLADVKKA